MNHNVICCQHRLRKYNAIPQSLQNQQKIVINVISKKEPATTYFALDKIHSQSGYGVRITGEMTAIN